MQDLVQDSLLIIYKNQQLIDALTQSNTQLIQMLLSNGIGLNPQPPKHKRGRPTNSVREAKRLEQELADEERQYVTPPVPVPAPAKKAVAVKKTIAAPVVAISKHTGKPVKESNRWSPARRAAYKKKWGKK